MLPGFKPVPSLLGMDSTWSAPGWKFILGSQDPNIRNIAASNNWLVTDTLLSMPFTQMRSYDMNFGASIEPTNSIRIQLDARKSAMGNYQELFRVTPNTNRTGGVYNGVNPARSGSYSISIIALNTAFVKDDSDNNSPTFNQFTNNLDIVKARLEQENPDPEASYPRKSQDVMIPAFLAAYTGKSANTSRLTPFPKIPIPGWRIDFNGLNKIPALSNIFSSISINSSYSATYSVSNYNSSLAYMNGLELNQGLDFYPMASISNENDEWIPGFLINSVVIQERFAPLIGVNFRTKSKITARLVYNKERNIALNMSNAQVTELKSNDLSAEIGFTKAHMKLPFKSQGKVITLDNDLTFKLNFTVRDTKTVQRKIDDVSTITAGNINFQLRPQISYVLSERLNLNVYFERNINTPLITSSFPRSTTAFGAQVRFSLAQ